MKTSFYSTSINKLFARSSLFSRLRASGSDAVTILFVFLLLSGCGKPFHVAKPEPDPVPEGYRMVWSDEFNTYGAPDSSKWRFEKGFVRNREDQWYQEDNAWCENGRLIIEARRDHKPNPNYVSSSNDWRRSRPFIEYTSSSIRTSKDLSWQYGRFEMRARFDTDAGLWPAWWTLGVKGEWPSNGEIDIMEYYRGKLLANVACGTSQRFKAEWYSVTHPIDSLAGPEWSKQFHVWRMDWNEEEISLYVDSILLNRVPLEKVVNKDGSGINPFKQKHYMLLNLALGGDNGGDLSGTAFPKRYEIDYVRVYQK